jgi:hypothetical protein
MMGPAAFVAMARETELMMFEATNETGAKRLGACDRRGFGLGNGSFEKSLSKSATGLADTSQLNKPSVASGASFNPSPHNMFPAKALALEILAS